MRFRVLGVVSLGLLAVGLGQTPTPARVSYSRSFKGSQPAFFTVSVSQDGQAAYQVREQDTDPVAELHFTASAKAITEIFAAAAALDDFSQPLQSKAKVAYTGDKMLAFDDATHHTSQEFTYTTIAAAAGLVALFEKISVAGSDAVLLRRAAQYDRLNALDVVKQIEQDWDSHAMAEPQVLVPALEETAANTALMEAARRRAQALASAMSGGRR